MHSQRPFALSRRDILRLMAGASAWLASGGLSATQKPFITKRAIPGTREMSSSVPCRAPMCTAISS